VQNVLTSHRHKLLEEELIQLSEYEVADSDEDTAVVRKLDARSLLQMFKHCGTATANMNENYTNYERVFACNRNGFF
jgi:hypothetical protein